MKKLTAMLLALVMLLSMAACGAKEVVEETPTVAPEESTETPAKPEEPAETPEAEEEKENVEIEVYIVSSDWIDAWDVMEARFEEQYPYIDVISVGNAGQDNEFVQSRVAAKDLPHIISAAPNETWTTLASEGMLMDLSELEVSQDIPQAYRDAFTHDGVLYGLSQGAAFSAMFYNMAMLREAGWETVPTCWEELIQCCKDLQAAGLPALVIPGGQTTNMYLLLELLVANEAAPQLGQGVYEELFKDGKFILAEYPRIAEKLEEIIPYFIIGSGTTTQDEATAIMTEGQAAICLAGNWLAASMSDAIASATGDPADAKVGLPPFNDEGNPVWISVSPENGHGISLNPDHTEAEKEASLTFFNWLHQPENFMLIQNARGTVPILSTMTDEHIVLPQSMDGVVAAMGAAPYVTMNFNINTATYKDTSCTALQRVLSGDMAVDEAIAVCDATVQESYRNQG